MYLCRNFIADPSFSAFPNITISELQKIQESILKAIVWLRYIKLHEIHLFSIL